uniref:Uncharacterized protein n=1 Tax=Leptocylindrus danicus TaxID=163516 RepID=A0A7S2K6N7_9STRA
MHSFLDVSLHATERKSSRSQLELFYSKACAREDKKSVDVQFPQRQSLTRLPSLRAKYFQRVTDDHFSGRSVATRIGHQTVSTKLLVSKRRIIIIPCTNCCTHPASQKYAMLDERKCNDASIAMKLPRI